MPVNDIPTMNAILAGWLGPNRGAGSPASYDVRLWIDDPRGDTPAEADWGGYPAGGVEWSSDDWLTPEGGVTHSDGLVNFGAPSSAGSDAARYWGLFTGSTCVYSAPLSDQISVTDESVNPIQIRLTVPYGGRDL
jgi:hypothetical protein